MSRLFRCSLAGSIHQIRKSFRALHFSNVRRRFHSILLAAEYTAREQTPVGCRFRRMQGDVDSVCTRLWCGGDSIVRVTLHFAQQQFLSALRDSIVSEEPLRNRLEKLCSGTIDKIAADPCLTADTWQRIANVRRARTGLSEMPEAGVRELLAEIVTIFDALEADYYGPCFEKSARSSD